MADKRVYDVRSFPAVVGGEEIQVEPIRGVVALEKFERALMEEIGRFRDVYERRMADGTKLDPEALLMQGVDVPRLLLLGLPDTVTQELLDKTTVQERLGLLTDVLYLNNLGRFAPFVSPELILELSMRLGRTAPDFPMPALASSSSEPASTGGRSSKN